MKVAMLGWEFPPFMAGGLGIHCLELTLGMARQGVAIDFYMPRMQGREGPLGVAARYEHLRIKEIEADAGIGPYEAGAYPGDFNAAVMAYNDRLVASFDSDADVLHCHDWITVPAALEIKRRTGLPLVFTVHSMERDRTGGGMRQAWIEAVEQAGVHGADRVIAVSRYTKALLERTYGADPEKVVAIHNGIDARRFNHRRPPRPAGTATGMTRLQRPGHDGRLVLFLSRLSVQKGPLHFLDVARKVLAVRPDAGFVVAGQGEMMPECIDHTLRHGIADRVRFTGFVPVEELGDFYRKNDIYVLPSVSEPFGISVLEAMASGLPTIVTKTSGVGEAIQHVLKADFWDTDEMADMIVRLLDLPELREEMGRNGHLEAQRFRWDDCCQHTIDTYQDVIQ